MTDQIPSGPAGSGDEGSRTAGAWSAAFDALEDAVCLLELDGTVRTCNRAMLQLLDLASGDVVGKKCYALMHGARTFFERCPYQEMLRTGRRESFELALDDKWYEVTADPLFGEAQDIVGAVHIVRDITRRKRAEEALLQSERRLSLIYDNVSDAIATFAVEDGGRLRVESVNKAFLGKTRLDPDDVVGRLVDSVIPKPLLTDIQQRCAQAVREKCAIRWELSERHPAGMEVGDAAVTPLWNSDGTCGRLVITVHDVTARARAEQAQREHAADLANINTLALDLASLGRDADLGGFLAERLRELTGAAAVAFSEYDPGHRVLATRTIQLAPGVLRMLTAPLLHRLEGTRSPVSTEAYQEILANANATRATLTDASFGAIPATVDATVRKLVGLDRFIGLGYVIEGELYGTSIIAMKAGARDPPRELLDAFANLAAVSLRRRRAEAELNAATVELDHLFALSGDLLGIANADGIILRANPAWESTLGYKCEKIEGSPLLDLLHPDDRDSTMAAMATLAKGTPIAGFVNRQRHRDGSYRFVEWRITPEAGLFYSVGRDITEHLEAEAREEARRRESADALRRSSAYNRSLIEADLDPLVTIGPDGMITDVNEATVTVTGRARDALLGSDFAECFSEPDRARTGYELVFREGSVRDLPLTVRHSDGRLTDVLYNASVLRDDDGNVVGVFAAARDVTALKRAEQEIRLVNVELERRVGERTRELTATNRDLQEFMYSLAHDLRGPLRAVDGFSYSVLEDYRDVIDDQGQDDLHRVRAAAQQMGVLIDALLSLSQLGRHGLELRTVDLSGIATRVIADLRASDAERVVEATIQQGLLASSDEALITIVLENLLGNAWKFTSGRKVGHIEFGAGERDDLRVFSVRDDGAGFDQAYADKLFKPFQRLHPDEEFPGTGTGLATVARILERLGGLWWAEGEVGRGATFSFSLVGGNRVSEEVS